MSSSRSQKKVQIVVLKQTTQAMSLLLLQTNKERGSFWQNITGSVEENEDLNLAAQRELFEETGMGQTDYQLLNTQYSFTYLTQKKKLILEHVYAAIIKKEININLSKEHQAYQWVETSLVKNKTFFFTSNYEAFLVALKYAKKV